MSTKSTNKILAILILLVSATCSFAQENRTCTVIEVSANGYSDKVWLFSVAGTTEGFDNGWDGYKFLTNSSVPQIYVKSSDGNFQVSTTANIHQQTIGFIPGLATNYEIKFTHTDLALTYKALYIHDKITGKTIDIFEQNSTYTFTAKTSDIKDRFVMLTSITNEADLKNEEQKKDRTTSENKAKKVKIFNNKKTIIVNNPNKQEATVRIFNAQNGSFVLEQTIQAENNQNVITNTKTGAYVVSVSVDNDTHSSTLLLQ